MKVTTRKIFKIYVAITSTLTLMSCKKFVEIPVSPYVASRTQVYSDSVNATAALMSLYRGFASYGFDDLNGGITLYTGLSCDELYPTGSTVNLKQLYTNSLSPETNTVITSLWIAYYKEIYLANDCIEGINGSGNIKGTAKNQLVGEAKVIRAFCFFNLVNIFGSVPLVNSTDYIQNENLGRVSIDNVYGQIIKDLQEAVAELPATYISSGRARINKYAAMALLARVYLYRQRWKDAETLSSSIISSTDYALAPDLNNVFLSKSSESIWQLQPSIGLETGEGSNFIPSGVDVLPSFVVSDDLLKTFEPGDLRKSHWLASNSVKGNIYYYPYKYKLAGYDGSSDATEYYMVFRLAEQYLIRAEARIKQGKIIDGIADINTIRRRSRAAVTSDVLNPLPDIQSNLSQNDALKAIAHERQVELFCEWGHRWFDLKRTGEVDRVMQSITTLKGGIWESYDQLYPLSISILNDNHNLIQTPGYH